MPKENKIPKLFAGSIDDLTKPAKIEGETKKKDLKKVKKQKTLFISQDMNMKLIELYAHEGRRQSAIVEDAVNLYYYLKKAMGERKFGELMSVVAREDEEKLREYLEKLSI